MTCTARNFPTFFLSIIHRSSAKLHKYSIRLSRPVFTTYFSFNFYIFPSWLIDFLSFTSLHFSVYFFSSTIALILSVFFNNIFDSTKYPTNELPLKRAGFRENPNFIWPIFFSPLIYVSHEINGNYAFDVEWVGKTYRSVKEKRNSKWRISIVTRSPTLCEKVNNVAKKGRKILVCISPTKLKPNFVTRWLNFEGIVYWLKNEKEKITSFLTSNKVLWIPTFSSEATEFWFDMRDELGRKS